MSFHVNYEEDIPCLILPLTIDLSNSHLFKETLFSLYTEGHKKIIVDFSQVQTIDSSGLGKILLFHQKMKDRGGELRIININSENIQNMFRIIQLQKVLFIEGMTDEE